MKLYNTLTRKIEDLKQQDSKAVTVYSCGPTVYDYPHIGNWFTFIRYDILIRSLKVNGFNPKWVMNITDVGHLVSDEDEGEDKLEKGARREGKSAWDIAKFYTDNFVEGLKKLNFVQPDILPRATDHIAEQIELIRKLEKNNFTYVIRDGVYFDTSKFADYGKLAKLDLKNLIAGARVVVNPDKRSQTDFALWKFSPKNHQRDMEWDSPWGKGFPGWHLECSAMSMKYLGETLDIHAGGIDHIPVHHTNEIAQSEGATGKQFAHIWVHMNHILLNDTKISKSLGNGITLEDIEAKGFSPRALRLLVLESHYQTQATFSWDALKAAQNRLNHLYNFADLKYQASLSAGPLSEGYFNSLTSNIKAALANDLNTPEVLKIISEAIDYVEQTGKGMIQPSVSKEFSSFLLFLDSALGLDLSNRPDLTKSQQSLLESRSQARQAKDWKLADKLRDELIKNKIIVNDTAAGQIWSRS